MNNATRTTLILGLCIVAAGCASPMRLSNPLDYLKIYRTPEEMRELAPPGEPIAQKWTPLPDEPQAPGEKPEVPLRRPLPVTEPTASAPENPDPGPLQAIVEAREQSTQHPTAQSFINAVQVYQFESGAVYEIFAAPTFITTLHLRRGEELKHLAAGDTSRWLIDIVGAGDLDSTANGLCPDKSVVETQRVSVLIKPRFPALRTNLVIATNERTYLIDLKSLEDTYHSAVEWTYPQPMTYVPPKKTRSAVVAASDIGPRNFVYSLWTPSGELPPWAPEVVYDDGHRTFIQFSPSINDHERPPLYLLDANGKAQIVNYRTEPHRYVVDQLFDRAKLRIGSQFVVILRAPPGTKFATQRVSSFDKE